MIKINALLQFCLQGFIVRCLVILLNAGLYNLSVRVQPVVEKRRWFSFGSNR